MALVTAVGGCVAEQRVAVHGRGVRQWGRRAAVGNYKQNHQSRLDKSRQFAKLDHCNRIHKMKVYCYFLAHEVLLNDSE